MASHLPLATQSLAGAEEGHSFIKTLPERVRKMARQAVDGLKPVTPAEIWCRVIRTHRDLGKERCELGFEALQRSRNGAASFVRCMGSGRGSAKTPRYVVD